MAVFEAVTSKRARTKRPVVAHRSSAPGWRRSLVAGRPCKGGILSALVDEYLMPLCPLRVPAHEDRYLAIDSSQERFHEFTTVFANPVTWIAKGHLVIVTGDRGFGKTSLIQRCALWLRDFSQSQCGVIVVDLSDERWPPEDTEEERVRKTFAWMLDELRDVLHADEISRIRSRTEISESFRDLERALSSRRDSNGDALPPIALVVLLPGYPRPAEVARYYALARRGMFFFAELFDKDDIEMLEAGRSTFNRVGVGTYHMALSVLKLGDATLLVDWIRREGGGWPDVPAEIQDHFDDIVARYKIGMSELTRLTWGTLCEAANEAAVKVTHEHINRYYEQARYTSPV